MVLAITDTKMLSNFSGAPSLWGIVELPVNRVLLICKSRFGRFLRIDSAKSTFIDLLKKIDQID